MFDFEKLIAYQKAKLFNQAVRSLLVKKKLDRETRDQLRRASLSIALNLAEGTGRFTRADKRNFYVIARSSLFESIAVLDILHDDGEIEESQFSWLYKNGEELSKIIFAMIKNLTGPM